MMDTPHGPETSIGFFRTNARTYEVVSVPDLYHEGKQKDGLCDHVRCKIFLRDGQGPQELRDTFMHEVLHAIFYSYGFSRYLDETTADEERLVCDLAPAMLATLDVRIPLVDRKGRPVK